MCRISGLFQDGNDFEWKFTSSDRNVRVASRTSRNLFCSSFMTDPMYYFHIYFQTAMAADD
jgi:hypothetical protein